MPCRPPPTTWRACAPTSPGTAASGLRSPSSRHGASRMCRRRCASRAETGTPVVTRGAGTGLAGGANGGGGRDRAVDARDEPHPRGAPRRPARRRRARHPQRRPERRAGRARALVGARPREPGDLDASAATSPPAPAGCSARSTASCGMRCSASTRARRRPAAAPRPPHASRASPGWISPRSMIGSEGTLGVIVGATLQLRRLVPGEVCTIAANFPDVRPPPRPPPPSPPSGVQPAIMELMDAASLRAVDACLELDLAARGAAQLHDPDGRRRGSEPRPTAIATSSAACGGTVPISHDRVEGERLLAIRRSMHPAMEALGTTLIEDVSVPRSALPGDVRRDRARRARPRRRHPDRRARGRRQPASELHLRRARQPVSGAGTSGTPPTTCSARRCASAARSPASTASACSSAAGCNASWATTSGSCSARSARLRPAGHPQPRQGVLRGVEVRW